MSIMMEVSKIKYEYKIIVKALFSKLRGKLVVDISNNIMSGYFYLFRKKQIIKEIHLVDNHFRYNDYVLTPIGKIPYLCEGVIDEMQINGTISTKISKMKIEGYRIKEK
ncbi:hypothetical protein KHQ81_00250 [Mycoplasmatota bacterium]|nr:hypothetical protein KHQ81_00250 [Mycoplasmatota bacterium]